jgi:outer membrane receptor protein involved in Fe transport
MSTQALAQQPDEQPAADIVVTGSRIARSGYDSPTPTTILDADQIRAQAPANLGDFVNTLPSISGSSTAGNSSGLLSRAQVGINSPNLRSLGMNRTLVLLDGQRSVASTPFGWVDINTFPQDLVKRVEIVTGGASAAYGSDAVGGVVNFILDKEFQGLKLSADSGITTYGDAPNYRAGLTAGVRLADDRLHLLFSGEYYHQTGVDTIDRSWNGKGYFQINNPDYTATNGQPYRLVQYGIGASQVTPGGLIVSGPLRGTYFGNNGAVGQLNFGQVSGPWMVGGDTAYTQSNYANSNSLAPDEERISLFGRAAFDLTPNIQIFGQFSYNRYEGQSIYLQPPSVANVTIRADNAYIPDAVRSQLNAAGATSFTMGTTNADFPAAGSDMSREIFRYVAGAKGHFRLGEREWKWDAYYQKGIAKLHEQLTNIWNTARLALAQDAVFAPAGNAAGIPAGRIVCRSTLTAPTNGCVPLNRLGVGVASAEALAYVLDDPYRDQTITQDVAAATINGTLLNLPAGPVSIAFGGEWRQEKIDGSVESQYQSGWLYGNYLVNRGKYTVKEGFLEVGVPVVRGVDLNGAVRFTDYSLSGSATSWKVGATARPFEGLLLRGTISRDIRAGNLNELFAAGTARTNTVIIPTTNTSAEIIESVTGNRQVKPEIARGWNIGATLRPAFVPGLGLSVDYYSISIRDAIGTLSSQNTVNLCYEQNNQAACDNIVFRSEGGSNVPATILQRPFNFSRQKARGLDFDLSYTVPADIIPGSLSLRALVTHYIENLVDNGVEIPVDWAGSNFDGNATPDWVYRVTAIYKLAPVTLTLTGRGISDGVYNNNFIECTTGCPVSTIDHRTINNNHIDGAIYFDGSIAFDFAAGNRSRGQLLLAVNNALNRAPSPVGNGPDGNNWPAYAETNRYLYDVLGRTFRVAVKLQF